jgi:hypothetical protein
MAMAGVSLLILLVPLAGIVAAVFLVAALAVRRR